MKKRTLYVDMDDTICDFTTPFKKAKTDKNPYPHSEPGFFLKLKPKHGAIDAINELKMLYDLYILSRPSIYNIHCYTEKAEWVKKHFGFDMLNKLILSPDKSLFKGDFLVDDTGYDGQTEFEGTWMQFGSGTWPNWAVVKKALVEDHFGRESISMGKNELPESAPEFSEPFMQPRLLKYNYKYDCQGTDEYGVDYALVFAPKDACFNNVRSTLFNEKYKKNDYEIDINSVENMTIKY